MFFARLAEMDPAAMIMAVSRKTLVQRGPFNSSIRMEPTATICTMPRNNATAVSLSRWMLRRRASRITSRASVAAIAACAKPSEICEWKSDLSTQHLRGRSGLNEASSFQDRDAVAHSARLIAVVGHKDTSQRSFANQVADELLDAQLRLFVERRGWFIQQQDFRPVCQGARQRDALLLSAGKISDVAGSESGQTDALQQLGNFAIGQRLAALQRPESQVGRHVAGEQERTLRDHADAAAQFARRKLAIVLALEEYGAVGRLVEAIQQSQEGAFAGTAGADNTQQLCAPHVERDVADDRNVGHPPTEVLGAQNDGVRRRVGRGVHRSRCPK